LAETEETTKKAKTEGLRNSILTMVMFFVLVLVIDESRIVVLLLVCKGKTKDGDMQHGHVRNSSAGRLRLTGALHCIAKCEDAVQIVPIPRIENVLLVGMAFTVVKGPGSACLSSVLCKNPVSVQPGLLWRIQN
jgi:hypothetical protein